MPRFKGLVVLLVVAVLGLIVAAPAFSFGGPSPTPGAVVNCIDDIVKQNANGQTGAQTGNATDPKQAPTAVTDCDHFWQVTGAIGNGPPGP